MTTFSKDWKIVWELKSFNYFELIDIVFKVMRTELDDINKDKILLSDNLITDYDADSVDIVAILLRFEDLFKNNLQNNNKLLIPTDKLGQIIYVEDLVDLLYRSLLEAENKMENFQKFVPDFEALNKQRKIGEL